MPKATFSPTFWPVLDEYLNVGVISKSRRVMDMYNLLMDAAVDPQMPSDFASKPTFSDPPYPDLVDRVLDCVRNHDTGILNVVGELAQALQSHPAQGQKRDYEDAISQEMNDVVVVSDVGDNLVSILDADVPDPIGTSEFGVTTRNQTAMRKGQKLSPYVPFSQISSSPQYVALKAKVTTGLASFITNHGEEFPLWDPSSVWKDNPDVLKHLEGLKIPSVPLRPTSEPDLLLYALGNPDVIDPEIRNRIKNLVDNENNWNLVNASGSGKTRLLFEIIVACWSFYLTCGHDDHTSPYGSRDVCEAISILIHGVHYDPVTKARFEETVIVQDREDDTKLDAVIKRRASNMEIATQLFKKLMFSRYLVLELFLISWQTIQLQRQSPATSSSDLPKSATTQNTRRTPVSLRSIAENGGLLDPPGARRAWGLLQIQPHLGLSDNLANNADVFSVMFQAIQWTDNVSCDQTMKTKLQHIMLLLRASGSPLGIRTIVFDEVQSLVRKAETAFGPESETNFDNKLLRALASRPVLKPLTVAVVQSLSSPAKVFLAGTKLNEFLMREAILSGSGKHTREPKPFFALGDQGDEQRVTKTLHHFLGTALVLKINKALRAEIDYWLTARHRFLVIFIQYVLQRVSKSMHEILMNLISRLTGYKLGNLRPIPEIDQKRILDPANEHLKNRIKKDKELMFHLLSIVHKWIFGGTLPLLPDEAMALVTLGIGRLVPNDKLDSGSAIITENIVAASLLNWFDGGRLPSKLQLTIDQYLSDPRGSVRGFGMEDALLYLFWKEFTTDVPLTSVFNFCYLPPAWRVRKARLINVFKRFSPSGNTMLLDEYGSSRLAWDASGIEGTAHWFEYGVGGHPVLRVPFLKPDNNLGPDLIFGLLLDTGEEILVSVQSKAWLSRHRASEVEFEAFKLSPEGFYRAANLTIERQPQSHADLDALLSSSTLDMSAGLQDSAFVGRSKYADSPERPKWPILRVFAALDQTFHLPNLAAGALGRYPLATLSPGFLTKANDMFSGMAGAVQRIRNETGKDVSESALLAGLGPRRLREKVEYDLWREMRTRDRVVNKMISAVID